MSNLTQLRDGYGNLYSIGSLSETLESISHNYPWKTVAHRGYTASGLPENTIPSLIEAKKQGYNVSEADIRRTSDGVYVMNHDATITGTVNGESVTYTIANETYETISQVLLGTNEEYGEIYPPTWDEFCKVASILKMELGIDNRSTGADITPEIVGIAMKYGLNGKINYTQDITNVIATDPCAIVTVTLDGNFDSNLETYKGYLTGMNDVCVAVTALSEYCTAENIIKARKCGFLVKIWGISATETTYTHALDLRPDYIEQTSATQKTNVSELYINNFGI